MGETIEDYNYDPAIDFENALEQAEANACSGWEEEFVENIRDKYEEWEERCYLSERQYEVLMKIANR